MQQERGMKPMFALGKNPIFSNGNFAITGAAWGQIVGGVAASAIASLVNNGLDAGALLPGITDALLTVGAPTVVGMAAVAALDTSSGEGSVWVKAGLAGTFAVGAMIAVGALPATIDMQTIALIGICGGGAAIGGSIITGALY